MMQLRGREVRTTDVETREDKKSGEKVDYVDLKAGRQVFLGCDNPMIPSTEQRIYCNWRDLGKNVRQNDLLYIDDGQIILLVTDYDDVFIWNKIFSKEHNVK